MTDLATLLPGAALDARDGAREVSGVTADSRAAKPGVVFFAVRALLALVPALTVTFPIKKVAAAAAFVAAAFYLLLSGAEVATQRSFLMTAVVLIAVIYFVPTGIAGGLKRLAARRAGRGVGGPST